MVERIFKAKQLALQAAVDTVRNSNLVVAAHSTASVRVVREVVLTTAEFYYKYLMEKS